MSDEYLTEFFKRKNKSKNPTNDDKVIDKKDANKYKSLFTNSIKAVEGIVKDVIPNIKLDSGDVEIKETDIGDYIKIYMFKDIVSFPDNYSLLKLKYPKVFDSEKYSDVNGSKLHKWLVDNILKKTESKGFSEYRYTDQIYNYTKENQNDTFLGIAVSDDYEKLSISMTIYYKKDNLIEEAINISREPLLELFKRRQKDVADYHNEKHPLPNTVNKKPKKEYDVNKINSDVTKIKNEVKKMLREESDLKKYFNNGISISNDSDTFFFAESEENEKGEKVYLSGIEFDITSMDLWECKEGNPRILVNETGDHPVYKADALLRKLLSEKLKSKFPHFEVVEYGGDWDTGTLFITLK